jgi:5'-nucleotidase
MTDNHNHAHAGQPRPLILLTNDDGVFSPGLWAAAEAVTPLGDLLIAAPHVQQSGMGRALPRTPDGGIIETVAVQVHGASHIAYAVHGSPAQCVRHAVLELAPRPIDLVVSGINYGENLGASITASGTVGAAIEGALWGIPGLAASLEVDPALHMSEHYGEATWAGAVHFVRHFAALIMHNGLPEDCDYLNLNVPADATPETPVRATRQGRHSYFVAKVAPGRDFATPGRFSYAANVDRSSVEPGSDIEAFFADRAVSVTPLSVDMTARVSIQEWFEGFVAGPEIGHNHNHA